MLDQLIHYLSTTNIPVWGILGFALFISFLENVFPPSPSDTIVILLGSFAGFGKVGFVELIVFSTIGSTLGFLLMYYLGMFFGHKILLSGKLKFINEDAIHKTRAWFGKYGYWVIIANRFLSGTRAVISFFAGITDLKALPTIILSSISALIWNAILIILGMEFGQNWNKIDHIIGIYGDVIFILVCLVVLFFFGRFLLTKLKTMRAKS